MDRAKIFATLTKKDIARFWSKIDVRGPDDCWPWIASHAKKHGRGAINFYGFWFYAPRTALALKDGAMPDAKTFACHTCDNPPCCNPAHLWWGTLQDNMADAVSKGRMHKWNGERAGQSNPRAKLKADDIPKIRADTRSSSAIAAEYGVSRITIFDVKNFATWNYS